jgi:FkbM family methyltransferase
VIRFAKRLLRTFGIEVKKYLPSRSEAAQTVHLLKTHRINIVFDVGANVGQYGHFLRDAGYRGRIVSFEPLAAAHAELVLAAKSDALWEIAPRMALSDAAGGAEINVAGNSVSSSLLGMTEAHLAAAPFAANRGTEPVRLERFDAVAGTYLGNGDRGYLKIDTQGYEDRVLAGAQTMIEHVHGLQLELSLLQLYQDQPLFDEMYRRLRDLGFELHAIFPEFYDQTSGRLLQFDGVFFRPLAT